VVYGASGTRGHEISDDGRMKKRRKEMTERWRDKREWKGTEGESEAKGSETGGEMSGH
jgi:hypothetical protein